MCFVPCPAPNRSVKDFAVELSLCISTFIGIPRSWYIQCGYRSIPSSSFRDLVTRKVAVHEDYDLVNMFLSSESQRCFGLSHEIPRCMFQRDKVEFTRFNHSPGQNVSLFQQDPICLGPSMKVSCKQICILLLHLSSESESVFRLTPVCLAVSLVVCSQLQCSYCILISDDERSVSQVSFDVQVLSSLINSNSEHTIQQQKAFHV